MFWQKVYLVHPSPWPFLAAFSSFSLATGLVTWFHTKSMLLIMTSLLIMLIVASQWARDVIREGTFMGMHTTAVMSNLRVGMLLFIASEAAFFFSFFWAFFHSSLAPSPEIGLEWPPVGVTPIDPLGVPLLNTAILLTSGITVTWTHHAIISMSRESTMLGLFVTASLGAYFSYLQAWEYYETPFTIADSVYGSTFFVTTGFHGMHVIAGTLLLLICLMRAYLHHFSPTHHVGFEASAWYWHFVDIIWIFLYLFMYHWGAM